VQIRRLILVWEVEHIVDVESMGVQIFLRLKNAYVTDSSKDHAWQL